MYMMLSSNRTFFQHHLVPMLQPPYDAMQSRKEAQEGGEGGEHFDVQSNLWCQLWCHMQETVQNLESSRDLWAVQLDSTRNRIIRIEVVVAIASFALLLCTVPAGFFGMNLTSGLEARPLPAP